MKILVTAGPTRERLDPVRYISNRSTGKMGYAVACAARDAGHDVTLVSGPVALAAPEGISLVRVESASEMAAAVFEAFPRQDLVVMAAAVADYRPVEIAEHKIKKQKGDLLLRLERTTDILAELGARKRQGQYLAGFAAESEDLLENARKKLAGKGLDWIAANTVADGFGTDTNTIILLGRGGSETVIGPDTKARVASRLVELITLPQTTK